jgi:hypothetical protein
MASEQKATGVTNGRFRWSEPVPNRRDFRSGAVVDLPFR